jgi:hypothetical protein
MAAIPRFESSRGARRNLHPAVVMGPGSARVAARCAARPFVRDDGGRVCGFDFKQRRGCERSFPRHNPPELGVSLAPSWNQTAQGRPSARARGPPATKKLAAVTTRFGRAVRPSLRKGSNDFRRALPRDRAFMPLSRADRSARLASASGGQDHTTSPSAKKRVRLMHLPHPRLACRDDNAYAPHGEARWAQNASDLGPRSSFILKNRSHLPHQIGKTGNLRMGCMQDSPVVPMASACCFHQ